MTPSSVPAVGVEPPPQSFRLVSPDAGRSIPSEHRLHSLFFFAALVPLTLLFLMYAGLSLQWRVYHDTPILAYCGYLLGHGFVPFRDFFDMNLPTTYMFFAGLLGTLGGSDVAMRIVDLTLLLVVMGSMVLALWPVGARPAIIAAMLYGILALHEMPSNALQRESILVAPVALS